MPHDFGVKPLYQDAEVSGHAKSRLNAIQQQQRCPQEGRSRPVGEWNETNAPPGNRRPRQCHANAALDSNPPKA